MNVSLGLWLWLDLDLFLNRLRRLILLLFYLLDSLF